jgi:hypothetical protein
MKKRKASRFPFAFETWVGCNQSQLETPLSPFCHPGEA